MFKLFSSKKNRFLGIDFGTSFIKIVELSYGDGQIHLENYGMVDLALLTQTDPGKVKPYEEKIIECLRMLLDAMETDVHDAYISIPGFTGLVTLIEFPEMSDEEIGKAIQFEAHKYIPTSLDEVAMSWEVVSKKVSSNSLLKGPEAPQPPANKKMQVLLVAAPKKEISKYERLVVGAGLAVKAIELEKFSIARALIGDDAGKFLILDIRSRATNILLVEKGIVQVNRNLDAGGNEITSTIADSMKISKQRSEDLKKGAKDMINGNESAITVPVLELIAGESVRILTTYKEKNKDSRIDGVILSGGTSGMKGIEEYFTKAIGIRAVAGNPWKRIAVDEKLHGPIQRVGAAFSVAIGLAMRGIEEYKRG
jgi:type IV pilus assembly protein PilM